MNKVKKAHQILQEIQSDWENGEVYEAFNIALESMERDILRKPTSHSLGDYSTIHYCQICNEVVSPGCRYCKECGQKLDWN